MSALILGCKYIKNTTIESSGYLMVDQQPILTSFSENWIHLREKSSCNKAQAGPGEPG